jgi:hypothetical protein
LKAGGNNPAYNLLTPQLVGVDKLTRAIDTMRKRKEFDVSVKRYLTILLRKLKEVEMLLANNDLSQEEKNQRSVVNFFQMAGDGDLRLFLSQVAFFTISCHSIYYFSSFN